MTERDCHHKISFTINGAPRAATVRDSLLLIDLIRDGLGLKGTKPGCGEGECGACTVLVNGEAVNSCLYLAVNIDGKEVVTVEGLSLNGILDKVQEALIRHGAVQCGFCTPGMVMSIKGFLTECDKYQLDPTREDIQKALAGNLCRCTGYVKIVNAVESLVRGE